jgi:tripartite-type tricarboxylate transporter receptor subunit TctC
MREAGIYNYSFAVWWMIMAPAGTPDDVVTTLNNLFTKINASEETRTFLATVASQPLTGTPAEMVEKLRQDIAVWADIAKSGNIQPQ